MIAKMLLSAALPEVVISGHYWSRPGRKYLNKGVPDKKDGKVQFEPKWVPVWYDRIITTGRGVGDRNPAWPEIAEDLNIPVSRQNKIGRYVLSTRPHSVSSDNATSGKNYTLTSDERGLDLRQDFKLLAEDLKNKKVLYNPSFQREDEDIITRIEAINGMSVPEWKKQKDTIEPKAIR